MISSALLLWIRIAWLGIIESECEKKMITRITYEYFRLIFGVFLKNLKLRFDLCNSYKKETVYHQKIVSFICRRNYMKMVELLRKTYHALWFIFILP